LEPRTFVEDGRHEYIYIQNQDKIGTFFKEYGEDIAVVIHTAIQPSHDCAAKEPINDFTINPDGTLVLREAFQAHCPAVVFLNMSTQKVYGNAPNELSLVEEATRWSLAPDHRFAVHGIDETKSIHASVNSLFGVSKAAGDLLEQQYGRNFGFKTACFRGDCHTGPAAHSRAQLHGFLAYLARCAANYTPDRIFGYKEQMRDDLARAFWSVFEAPRAGEIYNI
tara:strand:- start:10 stop:678 length:669 start_codon:yes stop_codon:yes gene_type:complete